jgi:hypothetical protein
MFMYFDFYSAHPYFDGMHDEEQEPISTTMFDWSWDNFKPTKDLLQNMVYEESLCFHPESKEKDREREQVSKKGK